MSENAMTLTEPASKAAQAAELTRLREELAAAAVAQFEAEENARHGITTPVKQEKLPSRADVRRPQQEQREEKRHEEWEATGQDHSDWLGAASKAVSSFAHSLRTRLSHEVEKAEGSSTSLGSLLKGFLK